MSNASEHAELDRLLNAAIDGELSEAEETALENLLRNDSDARRRYLQLMQLHAELHWDHGAQAALLTSGDEPRLRPVVDGQSSQQTNRSGLMFALVLAAVAAGILLPLVRLVAPGSDVVTPKRPAIATIEISQGSVAFRDLTGNPIEVVQGQPSLPAGTLIVEGESSAAQWRFLDGTLITVTGDAEIDISEDVQKMLNVRRGTLIAEVQPQPQGKPLIIETMTARVEVLGTVFTLAAHSEQTRINVAEGRVRMKRLVDGETIEVPQEHSCVASLDAREKLQPELPSDPAIGWSHRFTQPPPESWRGDWLAAEDDQPARVRAVPCLMGRGRESDRKPIVHYGISARRIDGVDLGVLPKDASLRLRFRSAEPARLLIFLGLHRDDGGFGGNFEVKLPRGAGTLQEDGWREVKVSLDEFHPIVDRKPMMPHRARPYLILITTFSDDVGLEVSELAIESRQP